MMAEFKEQPDQGHAPAVRPPAARDADRDGSRGWAGMLANTQVRQLMTSGKVQRAGATSAQQLDASVARAIEQRRGRGRALDESLREDMEASIGHDLSSVRVHDDRPSHELNEAVSARAFTTGNDVFFKEGMFNPGSSSGRELLAHELTHVVQQRTGASGLGPGEVSHPSDTAEQHAADAGRAVANQAVAPAATAAPVPSGIARQDEPDDEKAIAGAWETTAQRDDADDDVDEQD